jgi:hypothetical protein
MALDWVYAPQQLYFPQMPALGMAGVYYQHPEGTYYGEYVAWDGSYYSFYYTIQVNEGEYGAGWLPGAAGMDRYYKMVLYSWGPELYYVDDLDSKSFAPDSSEPEELLSAQLPEIEPSRSGDFDNRHVELDESGYDMGSPREYLFEIRDPGYTLRIEGQRFSPK